MSAFFLQSTFILNPNFSADLPFALSLEPFQRIFERCVDAGDEFVETVNNIIIGLFKFGLYFMFHVLRDINHAKQRQWLGNEGTAQSLHVSSAIFPVQQGIPH